MKLKKKKWTLNKKHFGISIKELSDEADINDTKSNLLLSLFDATNIVDSDFKLWAGYGDSGSLFSTKERAKAGLESVVNYVENDTKASKHAKNKLRYVTKILWEDHKKQKPEYEPAGILLLLAGHGNMCNVQKEVAITSAFAMLTNSLHHLIESQTLENIVLRLLRDFRYILVEELYKTFNAVNNIHSIALMTNEIAAKIGVDPINDPQTSTWGLPENWRDKLDEKYFEKYYTPQRIIQYILIMIQEKKIPYQKIVTWFEDNALNDIDKYDFLAHAINSDNGEINKDYLSWMLFKFSVFGPEGENNNNNNLKLSEQEKIEQKTIELEKKTIELEKKTTIDEIETIKIELQNPIIEEIIPMKIEQKSINIDKPTESKLKLEFELELELQKRNSLELELQKRNSLEIKPIEQTNVHKKQPQRRRMMFCCF